MSEGKAYPIERFLAWLLDLWARGERGVFADLRRGLSPATEHRAWPHIAQYCRLESERDRAVWLAVAGGAATLGSAEGPRNLGETLRRVALSGGGDPGEAVKRFEQRFGRLLTCRTTVELCEHLPGIFRFAKANGVGIDFARLYWDLQSWEKPEKSVQVAWASSFWGAKGGESREEDAE